MFKFLLEWDEKSGCGPSRIRLALTFGHCALAFRFRFLEIVSRLVPSLLILLNFLHFRSKVCLILVSEKHSEILVTIVIFFGKVELLLVSRSVAEA